MSTSRIQNSKSKNINLSKGIPAEVILEDVRFLEIKV